MGSNLHLGPAERIKGVSQVIASSLSSLGEIAIRQVDLACIRNSAVKHQGQ
jgi:hypothetical protein